MSTEIPTASASDAAPHHPYTNYMYSEDASIKESFLAFSLKVHELDEELGKFAESCLKLERTAYLLLVISDTREQLRLTHKVFFHNATALVPDMLKLASKDYNSKTHASNSERFEISAKYLNRRLKSPELPAALEVLGELFLLLHNKINGFREFTDEGLHLKSLLLTLNRDLMYRGSCARSYSERMGTSQIQHYIHQFINELQVDFEKVAAALGKYATVGVSATSQEQARSYSSLSSMLATSALFSGITASALQMSTGRPDQNDAIRFASMLWFMSLALSTGTALSSLIPAPRMLSPMNVVVSLMMDVMPFLLLGLSIGTFSIGLLVFCFSSQVTYSPTVVLFAVILSYVSPRVEYLWTKWTFLFITWPLFYIIKPGDDSDLIYSRSSKIHLGRITFADIIACVPVLFALVQRNPTHDDVEKAEGKLDRVKRVCVIPSALCTSTAAITKEQNGHYELILTNDITSKIELAYYGAICDVAYSDDGKWLAVTCSKKDTALSWTGIFDAETLTIHLDTFHEERAISGHLKWSPLGRKLIVKFEYRFDIWNLDANILHIVERDCGVQDVAWFGEDAFLVAEKDHVIKMNLTEIMAVYRFEYTRVHSIALVREDKYLVLITNVAKSEGKFEPASARAEKRVIIYDMDKREEIYLVPVLDDISSVYPIPGTLDVLITHKDQKIFQPWSLDTGADATTSLKKRVITQRPDAGEYIGPICLAGNHNQFILNVTTSGGIDIWQRETGTPHLRFESPILRDEGVHCLSWQRSNDTTATFVTAGVDSHTLLVWRGEERLVPNTPASPESPSIRLSPRPQVTHLGGAPSSGSLSPGGVVPIEGTVTESSNTTDGLSAWSQIALSM